MRKTKVIEGFQFRNIDFDAVVRNGEPCIFKGALGTCPLVVAAQQSDQAAKSHLSSFDNQRPLLYYSADREAKTRLFYNEEINGFNYTTGYASLTEFFERLSAEANTGASLYIGSAELEDHFPEMLKSDGLSLSGDIFETYPPLIGIWLGNRTTAATHYDVSNNTAACVVGKRRFTLFPPNQINNLYPGPLEPTPGGQVVSMVDLNSPDFDKFPKFATALEHAEVAELDAGDVLVYPAMWWHQVEALGSFNVLINYWWNTVSSFVDDPMTTLLHAMLSLRDRPAHEKDAWRAIFDFYIFGDSNLARRHLPEDVWGALATLDDVSARRLRAKLLKKINR